MLFLIKINQASAWISEKLLVIFLGMNVIIVFYSVLCRYVFSIGQPWTEEVAISLMVWSVFLGCNLAVRRSSHIKVEVIQKIIPINYKRWVMILVYIGMLIFLFIVFKYGLNLVYILRQSRSPALRFKIYWVISSIPIGLGFSFLQTIELLISEFKEVFSGFLKRRKV